MIQGDLFNQPATVEEVRRCGLCVHRNAWFDKGSGYCSPAHEIRGRMDQACASFFTHDQLDASMLVKGRAPARKK